MSQNITQHLNGLVKAKLKTLAMGEPHNYDVSACFAPAIDPQTQKLTGYRHSWLLTVSITNPLAGRPDIAVSFPIEGVVPPDDVFEHFAELLFEKCMKEKRRLLSPPAAPEGQPSMAPMPLKTIPGEVLESKTEPVKPKVTRERESHFPSKPGSGDLSADD